MISFRSRLKNLYLPVFVCWDVCRPEIGELPNCVSPLPPSLERVAEGRKKAFRFGRQAAESCVKTLSHEGKAFAIDHSPSGLPIFPRPSVGSISHKGDLYFAAAASEKSCRALGVDIESKMKLNQSLRVSQRILTSVDHELFQHLNNQLSFESFVSLVFSAKESLYKCLNPIVNQYFGFQDASLVRSDSGELKIRLNRDLKGLYRQGFELCVHHAFFEDFVVTAILQKKN